ncbi:interferon lambda receptor 1 [Sorex araneus]|uniref:interferon lambda receptor 1 n=1 Tax=Sorex araneus TaxID=42254 RepID=UPI002433DE5A|nr:interferon lambda receptor 1 [Sorex araneus]
MARAWPWVSLLLCLLQFASGKPRLAPPQNVTLLTKDFYMYLTWLPGPGNPQNVTYSVQYQSVSETKWHNVKSCRRTTALNCDLTCLKSLDEYNKFKAQVRAISARSKSHWVESRFLDYFFEVEPAPPVLLISQAENFLNINATYRLPSCSIDLDLNYQLAFWKEGTENKTLLSDSPVQIPLAPLAKGNYCLSARTIYVHSDIKYSSFSKPTCIFLKDPVATWVFLLLLLPVPLVIAIGGVVWKNFTGSCWSERVKMPQTLDFSGHRPTVVTLPPSILESLDKLSLHPQKELSIRAKLSAQGRSPVSTQAWTEKGSAKGVNKEEEEEVTDEDDDNDSIYFQPYILPPQLPEHSELGDWGTPPLLADKPPAWDSSSSSWTRTESSGYLSKEGSGQRLGREESPEPLLLPKDSEDSDSLEEPLKDELSSWVSCGSLLPGWTLDLEEPQVCLHTLSILSSTGEEEEGEEEEESGLDSDSEDCGASSWEIKSPQETETRGQALGHYMAR